MYLLYQDPVQPVCYILYYLSLYYDCIRVILLTSNLLENILETIDGNSLWCYKSAAESQIGRYKHDWRKITKEDPQFLGMCIDSKEKYCFSYKISGSLKTEAEGTDIKTITSASGCMSEFFVDRNSNCDDMKKLLYENYQMPEKFPGLELDWECKKCRWSACNTGISIAPSLVSSMTLLAVYLISWI